MTPLDALDAIQHLLSGNNAGEDATALLQNAIDSPDFVGWYAEVLKFYPLAGTIFSLGEDEDLSELGVDMQWMSVEESIDEASNAYPGIVASKKGYFPVGMCLVGSGDPYFLKIGGLPNPALVRVPHESCANDTFDEEQIEMVCRNVSDFFEKAAAGNYGVARNNGHDNNRPNGPQENER